MKQLLLSICLIGCGPAVDLLAPPAVPSPLVIGVDGIRVPLCGESLTDKQFAIVTEAFARWKRALPAVNVPTVNRECILNEPRVAIDPDAVPGHKIAWTDYRGISFKDAESLTLCVATHEAGHALGLIRHAPRDETGAMASGDSRGDCLPSEQDVAILRRTYLGTVSR